MTATASAMTKDVGVWTAADCALVLVDYQKEMFEVIRSETSADLVELNVRPLAGMARAFGMPIVLSTVGAGYAINGPVLGSVLAELDAIEPIGRSSMNAFEDQAFREFGQPEDVAKVALFLACDESSYVTGIDVAVDGGMKVW